MFLSEYLSLWEKRVIDGGVFLSEYRSLWEKRVIDEESFFLSIFLSGKRG